ncbi:phosphoenolpyruvate--protein phosphotransferase [Blautia hydrogenotrophica]|uniref:Phosphoenolpyruvate-protein phosphotransferase n=1 Tax=Blautia hydrogenotrophica (strain DSM 10507 / JCM 14656 / S5a33) TaxID=476272 RepID=C0CHR7_BLAHS|nr:phosphoenolpyruvate-protein phosphotransferase [Blautia hydrogenotrophica DSM 10507]
MKQEGIYVTTYQGKSILKGIAIGEIFFYQKEEKEIKRYKPENLEAEQKRYEKARDEAIGQLGELYKKACQEVGEVNAAVFEVHAMMLEDDDFNDAVLNMIATQGINAEYAVAMTGDNFSKMFSEMEDEYFKARAADIIDISNRVVAVLGGSGSGNCELNKPVILIAEDLAPSETVQLDKNMLLAFVTEQGSSNSHTAILARSMNIPALIGVPIRKEWNGRMAVVDGYTGTLYLDPDEETLKELKKRKQAEDEERQLLLELKGKEDVTLDGKHIKLYANIGNISDVAAVMKNDAEGIGLFRSEFLYLEKDHFPTEEEQFQAYKTVAEMMAGKKVIIRTLDIGADKQAEYFHLEHEENPAMGYRAIRICLTQPEIFKTQLRALFRASAFGNIAIMYPMIISIEEIHKIKEIVEEVKSELREQGVQFSEVEQGIMIETPAAAVMSDVLAEEVDFFSIGTNDLTQYTLAIDRQNAKLDSFYDAHHPAILRMIQTVIDNGHSKGCWVGICGELGADTELTETFLKMGIDELSVSPTFVLPVRKLIRTSKCSG